VTGCSTSRICLPRNNTGPDCSVRTAAVWPSRSSSHGRMESATWAWVGGPIVLTPRVLALTLEDRFGSAGPMNEAGQASHGPASMVNVAMRAGSRRIVASQQLRPTAERCSRTLEAVAEVYGTAACPLSNLMTTVSAVW
jgi:hypothetical protein